MAHSAKNKAAAARRDQDDAPLGDPRVLGQKLKHLRNTVPRPDGEKYSQQDLADEISRRTGTTCTRQYVGDLERGAKPNGLIYNKLVAIADIFDVPATYFFDNAASKAIDDQMDLVRKFATLTANSKNAVLLQRRLENLNPADIPKLLAALDSTTPDMSTESPHAAEMMFRTPGPWDATR